MIVDLVNFKSVQYNISNDSRERPDYHEPKIISLIFMSSKHTTAIKSLFYVYSGALQGVFKY